MKQTNYLHPAVFAAPTKNMGEGVYTREALTAGTLIETAPVIVMSAAERLLLDKTLLHDYIFVWGDDEKSCALALGYISLYNHSYASNCEYEMDFKRRRMSVKTVRDVKRGSELFINYNGDWNNDKAVWFEAAVTV
ncbi:MAG: SET domain-containing protein [Chitinophagaceae bacterium]